MILSVSNLTKSYDGIDILKNVSFHIEANDKLGITGPNGAGKTTLLKQIVAEETPDTGSVTIARGARIGYLSQMVSDDSDRSIYDEVLSVKQYLIDIENELRELERRMAEAGGSISADTDAAAGDGYNAVNAAASDQCDTADEHSTYTSGTGASAVSDYEASGSKLEDIYSRYAALSHRFELEGGYAVRSNVTGILKGLGFSEEEFGKPVSVLSGGQKTRLALGRLLMDAPEILILDEPTNHLDIASVSWLESYLKAWRGAVLIVSHDRYFLDRIVNKILDVENGSAHMYLGNYTAFADKKAALRKDMMKAWLNNQAAIRHQQEVIDKLKSFNREKSIKRAESREKALAKMERLDKPFDADDAMKLHFTPSKISGKDVLYAEGLSKSFGSKELFAGVELDVKRGEKLCIIGPNGTGKTTLLKIIMGLEQADAGDIEFGAKVEPAYYDQEHQVLDPDNSVFDEISDAYPYMNNTEIRNLLASFLFTGEDVFKLIGDLSGGEKGRVSLAKLMLSKANLLLLDEPTNHLDITSKEILEEAVRNYEGTVICVSHDRYFINRIATRIMELDHRHFVNYQGNYDYYLEKQADPEFNKSMAISGKAGNVNAGNARTGNINAGNTNTGNANAGNVWSGSANKAAFAKTGRADSGNTNGTSKGVIPEGSFDVRTDITGNGGLTGEAAVPSENPGNVNSHASASGSNSSGSTVYGPGSSSGNASGRNLSFAEQKERRTQLQKLRNALSKCEQSIAEHEEGISRIDEEIALPENATNSAKLNELSTKQAKLSEELEELYEKWEELSEELEAFGV